LALSAGLHLTFHPVLGLLSIPGLPYELAPAWSIATLELPPLVRIPKPPELVARPRLPLPPAVTFNDDLGIQASVAASGKMVDVGPPPDVEVAGADVADVGFVRYDVPPLLGNRDQFGRMVWYFYPLELQRAGIEGAVELAVFIDKEGQVSKVRVEGSSGWPRMDEAALQLAHRMEFLPALMRDQLVGVWVRQRVCFLLPKRDPAMTPAAAAVVGSTVDPCSKVTERR
jgi:TonB family protein